MIYGQHLMFGNDVWSEDLGLAKAQWQEAYGTCIVALVDRRALGEE